MVTATYGELIQAGFRPVETLGGSLPAHLERQRVIEGHTCCILMENIGGDTYEAHYLTTVTGRSFSMHSPAGQERLESLADIQEAIAISEGRSRRRHFHISVVTFKKRSLPYEKWE